MAQGRAELEEEAVTDGPKCHVCTEPIDMAVIFVDSRSVRGTYYCKQCADSLLLATDEAVSHVSQLTCPVCFSDKEVKMVLLGCGHAFCADCIAQLISRESKTCPSCRALTVNTGRVPVSKKVAVERFFAEQV